MPARLTWHNHKAGNPRDPNLATGITGVSHMKGDPRDQGKCPGNHRDRTTRAHEHRRKGPDRSRIRRPLLVVRQRERKVKDWTMPPKDGQAPDFQASLPDMNTIEIVICPACSLGLRIISGSGTEEDPYVVNHTCPILDRMRPESLGVD